MKEDLATRLSKLDEAGKWRLMWNEVERLRKAVNFAEENWAKAGSRAEQAEARLREVVEALRYAIENGLQHWSHAFTDVECPRCKVDTALVAVAPIVKHVVSEGGRRHVISWSSSGRHCSEPDCEINLAAAQPEREKGADPCANRSDGTGSLYSR